MKRLATTLILLTVGAAGALLVSNGTADAGSTQPTQRVREVNVDPHGYIRVHEEGTPEVSLTGSPRVGLDPTLGNVVKVDPNQNTVKVDQTGSGPLHTQAADNPAFTAVVQQVGVDMPAGSQGDAVVYTVPAHNDLVIEQVSVQALMPAGQHLGIAGIIAGPAGSEADFYVPLIHLAVASGQDEAVGDIQTRIYAGAGTEVECFTARDNTAGDTGATCSISGYLVPVK